MTAPRRRVLFVVPSLSTGGAERQLVTLLRHIDTSRFDPSLFIFGEETDLARESAGAGVRVFGVPRRGKLDVAPVRALAKIIERERVEAVHCTLQVSLLIASLALLIARRRGVVLVDAVHTTMSRDWRWRVANALLYVPLMRRCDKIIMVCDAQRAYWAARHPSLGEKLRTIHNGIDLGRFVNDVTDERRRELRRRLGASDGDVLVGMVAAIRPEKNHVGVLSAAARIIAAGHRVHFVFVGGALPRYRALQDELHRKAREWGIADRVSWVGNVANPRGWIAAFDVAVLFSTAVETFPLAVLECMAMGRPVVASDIGGVREMVVNGENGLLCPIGDELAFADAIIRLVKHPSLRAKMSPRACDTASRYSAVEMTRATEALFTELLGTDASP